MRWIAAAIVVAGALVGASVALTSHYSIGAGSSAWVFRLNHWSGEVVLCAPEITASGSFGRAINCRSEMTDAEVGIKNDWTPVPRATPDNFGGVQVERKPK
jgi:hypothetical protein